MSKKVMIVDDDLGFLEELKETLSLSGYEMVAVNDANLALVEANKARPDVILVDLKMPDKSGFQVADEIRHFGEVSNIPIIAMTGFLKDDYVPLLGLFGISKCLKKPFTPLEVITEIESVLGK